MKIAIISDIHANLPALDAVLNIIYREKYDFVVNLGDSVGIGPFPSECIDLLIEHHDIYHIQGNHEHYVLNGMGDLHNLISERELQHHRWTKDQLRKDQIAFLSQWPYMLEKVLSGVEFVFLHYAFQDKANTVMPVRHLSDDIEKTFQSYCADVITFGHTHQFYNFQRNHRHFINPGTIGCAVLPIASFAEINIKKSNIEVNIRFVPFNDYSLFAAFEKREVPDRQMIYKIFMGGRFHKKGWTS